MLWQRRKQENKEGCLPRIHHDADSASALDVRIFGEFVEGIAERVPALKLVA